MATSAERYNNVCLPQVEDGLKLIDRLSPALENVRTVLDIGCGTGHLTSLLSERVGPDGMVTGVDPDEEKITFARSKYGDRRNLVFADGRAECFPEGPYELIIANHVLHWVRNKELVFQNVYRNLTTGGQFAFVAVEKPSQIVIDLAALTGKDLDRYVYLQSADEYETIASKCNLSVEFKGTMLRKISFPAIEFFLEWFSASTGGLLDSNSTALADFKASFKGQPVHVDSPHIHMIFRKL